MPTEHFASKEKYRRWNAYRHLHGISAPNLREVEIGGKTHRVEHSSLSKHRTRRSTRK